MDTATGLLYRLRAKQIEIDIEEGRLRSDHAADALRAANLLRSIADDLCPPIGSSKSPRPPEHERD